MSRFLRHCLGCGTLVRGNSYCARCEVPQGQKYGEGHRKTRAALIAALRQSQGAVCGICGKVIGPWATDVELDHETPAVDGGSDGPRRLVHALCNSRRGGIRGTTYTPRRKR